MCVLVLIVHWPGLSTQAYCFDDERYLNENPLVQNPSWASAAQFMSEIFRPSTVGGYSHPLTMISLMLDYAFGGRPENLRPFRRTSLALHLMSTALVAAVLHLLFGNAWVAVVLGLLFGLHPLSVEPVAWLSQRKTLLASCLALVSLTSYLLNERNRRWYTYGLSLAAYTASLLSKPSAMPLPFLFLLLDYWPLERLNRRSLLRKVPFFIVCAFAAAVTLTSQSRTMGFAAPGAGMPTRMPTVMCYKFMFYLGKIAWPVDLSPYYMPPEPLSLSNMLVLASVIGSGLVWVVVLVSWRKTRALLVGALFFLVALLPMMGLVGFSWTFAFDNYLYLPSVGLLLPLAWVICRLWNNHLPLQRSCSWRTVFLSLGAVLCVLEVRSTRAQYDNWQTTEGLIRHMLRLTPSAAPLHNILGGLLVKQGNLAEGIRHLAESLRLDPQCADTHQNIAAALAAQGKTDQAVQHYEHALRLQPASPRTHFNLGIALLNQSRPDDALMHFAEAVRLKPTFAEAHINLGAVLQKLGKSDQAIAHYTEAIRLRPTLTSARKNLASALTTQGKIDQAIREYRDIVRLQPFDADSHVKLADLLAREGRKEEALQEYREAIKADPKHSAARARLSAALQGQTPPP